MLPGNNKAHKLNTRTTEQAAGWHHEHVKAALRASGVTLVELARRLGCTPSMITHAIKRPKSKRVEAAIAKVLRVAPRAIWPDRYPAQRTRKEAA